MTRTLSRLYRLAAAPELAITTGLLATLFLAIGSLAMQLDPAAYKDIPGEDVSFVWRHWSPIHSWLVAAIAFLGLFFVSTFVCTADALHARLRARSRALSAWATPLMHLGFLIGLVGHLLSAVGAARPEPAMLVAGAPASRAGGLELRLLDVKVENRQTGELRRVDAKVEVTDTTGGDGEKKVRDLGFNRPIVLDHGRRLVLLMRAVPAGGGEARFEVDGGERRLRTGEEMIAADATVRLLGLYGPPDFRTEIAKIQVQSAGGDTAPGPRMLIAGQAVAAGGRMITFLGAASATGLIVMADRNAGAPVLFAGMLVFTAGAALFIAGKLRRS